MPTPRNPRTPQEWQEAVDAADILLGLEAARLYGLVTGGPVIDVERCDEILRRGRLRGYVPTPREDDAYASPERPTRS